MAATLIGSTASASAPATPEDGDALNTMGSWADQLPSSRVTSDGQATSWEEQKVTGRRGVDVSYWNHQGPGKLDFNALKTVGVEYVIIKASEFMSGKEGYLKYTYYNQDKAAAKAAGMVTGAYQYANPTSTPANIVADATAQATGLVTQTGPVEAGELPLVLDLESSKTTLSKAELSLWAETWLATAHRLTGRVPMLYTYTNYLSTRLNPTPTLTQYPLWQAEYYYRRTLPTAVAGWPTDKRVMWQFSSKGLAPGSGTTYIDLNVFLGTDAQYQDLTRLSSVPPQFTIGQKSPRSQAAAAASLARMERGLARLSRRRAVPYRHKTFRRSLASALKGRGVTKRDLRFGAGHMFGQSKARTVWLRQTFTDGEICSVAHARRRAASWQRVACPRTSASWSRL